MEPSELEIRSGNLAVSTGCDATIVRELVAAARAFAQTKCRGMFFAWNPPVARPNEVRLQPDVRGLTSSPYARKSSHQPMEDSAS